ncbi:MAG TPA: PAS domain S-box protein [Bryobacteraceae bacterium]|nr:PAS domain S-box protein [Bryobacteraceae bacterium]
MAALAVNTEDLIRFFRHSSQIFCVIAEDGRLLAVNPAATEILGCKPAEHDSYCVFDVIHPDDAPEFRRYVKTAQTSRTPPPFPCRFRAADGTYRYFLVTALKLNGRIYASALDVTEFKRRQRARYQILFKTSKDGIVLVDGKTGTIVDVNRQTEEMLGYQAAELIGQKLWDAPPFISASIGRRVFGSLRAIRTVRREETLTTKNGSAIDCELLCHSYYEGAHRMVQCNVRDISERRRHEAALRESEERLRVILEGIKDYAIFLTDKSGIIQSWNRGGEQVTGYTESEIVGQSMEVLFTPEDRADGVPETLMRAAVRDGSAEEERWHARKDGSRFFGSGVLTSLWHPDGRLRGFVKVMRDITRWKQTDEALREGQRLESIGLLAGGIAHDFNNLLTGIIGNASLAAEELPRGVRARRMVDEVIAAGTRAADLTRQLLAYAGKGRFTLEAFRLSDVIREIRELIQASIPPNVQLELQLEENLPAVYADPSQMQQVAMNLVINAAEAIEDHGTVRVSTGCRELSGEDLAAAEGLAHLKAGQYVYLEVRDTGVGMEEQVKARIFDPFFTTKFTGRGLGLSAVVGIVRAHHGGIQVESAPQLGSTFRIYLPAIEEQPQPRTTPEPALPQTGSGTILLAEDERMVRHVSQEALERRGFRVLTATNGREAVELFRRRASEISLVVLDMAMPVMSGEEARRHIEQIRPDVPVLVSSGYSEEIAFSRFGPGKLGHFIQKPYTARQLTEKVLSILQA